jgi:hypothetical protein
VLGRVQALLLRKSHSCRRNELTNPAAFCRLREREALRRRQSKRERVVNAARQRNEETKESSDGDDSTGRRIDEIMDDYNKEVRMEFDNLFDGDGGL